MSSFTITVYLFCIESLYDDCKTTSHKQHDHGMSRNTSIILNIINRFQQQGRGLVNACAFYSFFLGRVIKVTSFAGFFAQTS